eukprot:3935354-Rhodomonas_salina.1
MAEPEAESPEDRGQGRDPRHACTRDASAQARPLKWDLLQQRSQHKVARYRVTTARAIKHVTLGARVPSQSLP